MKYLNLFAVVVFTAFFFFTGCSDGSDGFALKNSQGLSAGFPQIAPQSEAFSKFMEERNAGKVSISNPRFGFIPSPVDNSHLLKQKILDTSANVELKNATDPAYDLRTYNKVTSVKNQGSCGSCWTFAAIASAESSFMPGETNDFSENNMKNLHGFDWGPCAGGNFDMAAAYFMRWNGPVNEASDVYGESDPTSPSLPPVKHVKNYLSVSSASISSIKEAIVQYGVVYADFYYDDAFYNSSTKAYYYTGSENVNHAIAIVGWDNNYSKANFNTPPANDGAWIIKNSWGTGWGSSGYFYISYEDVYINDDCYVYETDDIEYDNLYSYDPFGRTGYAGYGVDTAWIANVFTATGDQVLKAVSFYANFHNTEYTVKIYTSPTTDPVTGGMLQTTKSGTLSHAGYNTIVLDTPVTISSGAKFSVVIKVRTPGNTNPIPLEMPVEGYASGVTANSGQSYFGYDDAGNPAGWTDAAGWEPNTNVNIKAYTDDPDEPAPVEVLVINEIDYDMPGAGDPAEFIELYNAGDDIADLSTYSVQLINGASGTSAIYKTITLPAVALASGDYYVICGNTTKTVNCDLDVTPDTDLIQNGGPDAVALYKGVVLTDTVSYEGSTVGVYTETTGIVGADTGSVYAQGISRYPDGTDTNNNNADFSVRCISPGMANIEKSSDCLCGNGVVDTVAGEQCEPSEGSCCTSSCKFATSDTVCNASTGQCDAEEKCTGASAVCPADVPAANGTDCDLDSNLCTQDKCQSGVCNAGSVLICNDSKPCTDDTCNPATGACQYVNDDTNSCSDGNACTQTDECVSGVCNGTNPVTCVAMDQCHDAGTCDSGTGVCSNPAKIDNAPCDLDSNLCTQDKCQSGICNAGSVLICNDSKPCTDDTCNPATGACQYANDDTNLCTDGDGCTVGDSCNSGSCVSGAAANCDQNCTNNEPGYICTCGSGYTLNVDGHTCEDIDECDLNTDNCDTNATCANIAGSFTCTCNSGYTGSGTTCSDIDECDLNTDNCDANATCANTAGSFTCTCNTGYTGTGTTCSDIDECDLNTDNCDANATCANIAGSFTCTCNTGYTGSGTTCSDIDECDLNTDNCDANATCANIAGSFTCTCNSGYTGSGTTCSDIDECNTANGGCAQNCNNTAGSYSCSCDAGYTLNGDGKSCDDIDECDLNTDNCDTNATCANIAGSFTCTCNSGYTGTGTTCSDIDECALNTDNCDANATCGNTPGSFTCTCNSGYTGSGTTCDDINECNTANGGCAQNCNNTAGSYNCSCDAGYTLNGDGKACDDINECDTANGGCAQNCNNTAGSYSCSCDAGYTLNGDGKACDDIDECDLNTDNCDANAACANTAGSFTCSCNFGYDGDGVTCSDVDECSEGTDSCDVNATCSNTEPGYDCSCNDGYSGDGYTCSDVDECDLNTDNCDQNCANTVGGFTCSCEIGYELNVDGHTCDDIAECGNGIVEPGEECETSEGTCCTSECKLAAADTICRAGAELCEEDAKCDGISGTCPENAPKAENTPCRTSAGECDIDDFCNGTDITCSDGFQPDETDCTGDGYSWTTYRCMSGICESTGETSGTCTAAIEISFYPYENINTTEGRPDHVTSYGTGCEGIKGSSSDVVYSLAVKGGNTYRIKVDGADDLAVAVLGACADEETCIDAVDVNDGGAEETEFTASSDSTLVLVVESISGGGGYTLTVEEIPAEEPDDGDTAADDDADTGNTGDTGDTGNTGDTGDTGNTGDTGDTGNTGDTGSDPDSVIDEDTGDTQPDIDEVADEDTGDTGNTGTDEDSGDTGNTGNTGTDEDSGDTGDTGNTGSDEDSMTSDADGTDDDEVTDENPVSTLGGGGCGCAVVL